MSEPLEIEEHDETERAERPVLHREFAANLTPGDGRTVDVKIVPYGERITHNDGHGGVAVGIPYQEEWVHGAFSHQTNAANRVVANYEHQMGIAGIIGHGLVLREEQDGLHGSFKIHKTAAGDTALELIHDGVLAGVSLEAIPRKMVRSAVGVVQRIKADLRGVAFTRFGAYASAKVLAVREEADEILDEEMLLVPPDPELIERCRRLGIELPQRYQAPPEDTGTPAETGTPEVGTRQPEANANTQE